MPLNPRDVFMGNPPSSGYQPRKADVVQLLEETDLRASETAVEAALGAVAPTVELATLQADRSRDEADRSEAAKDFGFANAKGDETIAGARALVADGETFIVYAPDAKTFTAYRRLTSTTQKFLGDYPSASVAAALPQNRRISDFTQRSTFVAGEIGDIRTASGDAVFNLGNVSVNSDGALVISGMPTFSGTQVYIDVGRRWNRQQILKTGIDFTLQTTDGTTSGHGCVIVLGDLPNPNRIAFTYLSNGNFGVLNPANSAKTDGIITGLPTFAIGDRVKLDVEVYPSGLAYLTATAPSGDKYEFIYQIIGDVKGMVAPATRRGGSDMTIHAFYSRVSDVIERDLPVPEYASLYKANLITSPGNTDVEGWLKSTPSASLTVERVQDTIALKLSHSGAFTIAFDVVRDLSEDRVSYRYVVPEKTLAGGVLFVLQHTDAGGSGFTSSTEIAGTRIQRNLPAGATASPRVYAGTTDLHPDCRRIVAYISTSGEGDLYLSEVMIAYGVVAGYVSPAALTEGKVDARILNQLSPIEGRVNALEVSGGGAALANRMLADGPMRVADLNHLMFYGQSNSIGATISSGGTLAFSLTQPYQNLTFDGGPRAWDNVAAEWSYAPLKPLVEDDDSTGGSGGAGVPLGETQCSGAANYASTLSAIAGVAPSDLIFLASTAGRGSYRIDQLQKGAPWYANFTAQITAANAETSDYICHFVGWIQGERDADEGTSYADYLSRLVGLQADTEADIQAISGQTEPVYLLVSQVTAYARKNDMTARAQFDAMRQSDKIFVITSSYRFPYGGNIHFTNVGAKLNGAYFGRAEHAMLNGLEPQMLRPISATLRGSEVRLRFEVPRLPLVFDTTHLAAATDFGFQVRDANGVISITGMVIDGPDVILTLGASPVGSTVVRYALDHAGAGRSISGGDEGCGNLRDSAPEIITLFGNDWQLFNVAPAFELGVLRLGE